MVQVIYDFLTTFIGDIPFSSAEGSLTLMKLASYLITLCLFSFFLFPVLSIFLPGRKGKH